MVTVRCGQKMDQILFTAQMFSAHWVTKVIETRLLTDGLCQCNLPQARDVAGTNNSHIQTSARPTYFKLSAHPHDYHGGVSEADSSTQLAHSMSASRLIRSVLELRVSARERLLRDDRAGCQPQLTCSDDSRNGSK